MRRSIAFILAAALLPGCSPRVRLAPLVLTLPDSTTVPIEYGPECAEARRMAHDSVPPANLVLPRPSNMPLPPLPAPNSLSEKVVTVKMVVDSVGRPEPSSILITGVTDRGYENDLRRTVADQRFRPALIGRCGVASRYQTAYQFSLRRQ